MLKLFSRVPLWALYGLAAFIAWIAFYVVRHRRDVIRAQLEKVFPAMSDAQRRRIHRQFLRNYCQVMVEILKSATMPEAALRERVRLVNPALVRACLDAGQSMMFMTSHMNNWEWLLQGVTLQLGYPVDGSASA